MELATKQSQLLARNIIKIAALHFVSLAMTDGLMLTYLVTNIRGAVLSTGANITSRIDF